MILWTLHEFRDSCSLHRLEFDNLGCVFVHAWYCISEICVYSED